MKDRQRRPGRGMPFRKSTDHAKSGGWRATLRAFVLLVVVILVFGSAIAYSIVSGGLSAHDEPSRAEEVLARAMRRWATPQAMRDRANPIQAEFKEDEETRRFLQGDSLGPSSAPPKKGHQD